MLEWHRLFGTMMLDRCYRTSIEVQLEIDMSLPQQFLDCALLKKSPGAPEPELPDGFSPLPEHTLISFKSFHEPLRTLAFEELIGHGVAYRKLNRNPNRTLLARNRLMLLLVCVRAPAEMLRRGLFTSVMPGVYNVVYGLSELRLIVIHELRKVPVNAPLLFFSADPAAVDFARQVFAPRWEEMSTGLLEEVLSRYQLEGFAMPFTADDFMREHAQNVLNRLTPAERMQGLRPTERLQGLRPEDVLHGLSPDDRKRLEALLLADALKESSQKG